MTQQKSTTNWVTLSPELVDIIHDSVLNPGELSGRAGDKSLDATLARVENRILYGMIGDIYDLAAAYAVVIARGHCFNDGNKRTAYLCMDTCLDINGIAIDWDVTQIGPLIIDIAQGKADEDDLAAFLRPVV